MVAGTPLMATDQWVDAYRFHDTECSGYGQFYKCAIEFADELPRTSTGKPQWEKLREESTKSSDTA